jgi:multiple sugar transport system substrate-binding protein
VINRPENVEALEYWVSLFRFAPPGVVDWYWDQLTTGFQKSIVAIAMAWNDQSYELENAEKSEVAGKMGYAVIPKQKYGVSHFGSWSWTISAKSKNPEAAWLYMQWVNSRDTALKCAKDGAMPSRKYVFDAPEIAKIPFMPATKEALEFAFPRPVHRPEWGQMSEILALYLTKAHRLEITPQEALDKVATEWQAVLKTKIIYPPKK